MQHISQHHNPAQPPAPLRLCDQGFNYATAHREGWTISEAEGDGSGLPGIQLQRLDQPQPGQVGLESDQHAWELVVRRAREGSAFHRQALEMVDDLERCLIEGYCGSW